ncbi:MFS transporter [Pectobacterium brasiliense]|uniref:MFS transporter n=1 Tax=Pectobacterium brasiliense TaxID=180957 RepID=UPI001968FB17|nr:MFS transporter [Pectobacterium brasiliense]MBN3067015.1 MFS transporter [Pectobacterium brasiliense]MBN3247976.1 MFS transporter [Pectobacterium brasiliense]
MNTLLFALIGALRSHRWLRLLGFAYILSSLGNGLTQVIIFGQLLHWQASPATLTMMYMLSMLPSFIGSIWGETLCKKTSPLRILIFAEISGLLVLVFPLYGLLHHSVPALLVVQCAEALLSGISYPALTLLFKRGLRHDELPAATAMETIIFASQVLLGTGLGVLLFDLIDPLHLLAIDVLSFTASVALLMISGSVFREAERQPAEVSSGGQAPLWHVISPIQKRSIMLLPALAAVGSPAMALLPALAQEIRPEDSTGLALPLLFARGLGQLCGPLMLDASKLQRYSANNGMLLVCLVIFIGTYFLLPLSVGYPFAGLVLIFSAHMASNIVFALGTFGILRNFPQKDVAKASAMSWRGQVLTAAVSTGITSAMAQSFGAFTALYSISLLSLGAVGFLLWLSRTSNVK